MGRSNRPPIPVIIDNPRLEILHELKVRENLYWALWHLRHENRTRVLWIDTLCINQEDEKEKNHQIRQMGRIFERAGVVVAWLGRQQEIETHYRGTKPQVPKEAARLFATRVLREK